MKVLSLVYLFPPDSRGGAETQCLAQARALAARGHEVAVWTRWLNYRTPRRETMDGVRVWRAGFFLPLTMWCRNLHDWLVPYLPLKEKRTYRSRDPLPGAVRDTVAVRKKKKFRWMAPVEWAGEMSFIVEVALRTWLGKWRADAVHVHETHWLAGLAHWVAERQGVPVVCTEHTSGEALEWPPMPDVPWEARWMRRRMDCTFLSISRRTRRSLEAKGISPVRILDVRNGVELPARTARVAEQSGAIYVGNFTQGAEHKGFDVLLKAWSMGHAAEPTAVLRLFGGGDAASWKQMAGELGCGDSVRFEGRTDCVTEKLLEAGFFVLPSRREGLSCALLEAQAAGLPAVVSDIEGNVEVVRHVHKGLDVNVGDERELANAMI